MDITLPHEWAPRDYQVNLWRHMEAACQEARQRDYRGQGARACAVWHRRGGKDLSALRFLSTQVFSRVGTYWHVFPTQRQGRKIVWEGKTRDGAPFLDAFPKPIRARQRDDELAIWFPPPHGFSEGSMYQVVGVENVDSLMGSNPVGVIFSEFSLYESERAWNLIRPILAENGGWALFIYTPRGRNHGYRLYQMAQKEAGWFCEKLTVDDTGAVELDVIDADRREGMPEALVQQEYWCSFDAPLVGSYYGDDLTAAEDDGRICKVQHAVDVPVHTFWDLGVSDATSIWFHQYTRAEHRLIDFAHEHDVGLEAYLRLLQKRPYLYGKHYVPHDAKQRSLQTGKDLVQMASKLGFRLTVVPTHGLQTGIQATRALIRQAYFDAEKCAYGLQALREYRKRQIPELTDPNGEPVFSDDPVHDWTSHPADALRTGAMGWKPGRRDREGPSEFEEGKPRVLAPTLPIA